MLGWLQCFLHQVPRLAGVGVNAGVNSGVLPVVYRTGAGVGLELVQGLNQFREMPRALTVQYNLLFGRRAQFSVIKHPRLGWH